MESHLESIAQIEEDYEEALQLIKEIREDKYNFDRTEWVMK